MTKLTATVVGAGGAVLGAASGDMMEGHAISLSTVFGIAGVVVPAAWWLAGKITRLDDRVHVLEKKVDSLPCNGPAACSRPPEDWQ